MNRRPHALAPYLLSLAVVAAGCVAPTHARPTPDAVHAVPAASGRPGIAIESPVAGAVVHGVAIIRFRTENISIESPFLRAARGPGLLPAGHLHVTVDGAPWHWVHATSDPVVITPLPPGEHTVELELAGADHRRLDSRIVHFTVLPPLPK